MDPQDDYADPDPLLAPAWWEPYVPVFAVVAVAVVGAMFAVAGLWCAGVLR